ncbi:MAG: hypothetical protein JXB88_24490 [Spirochaetales bacterium]|nr:hypothetical protein [Spirochaetales bacterium]
MSIKRFLCVLLLFYAVFISYSQEKIWDEDFSSNKNNWFTDESAIYFEKGMYVFNAKNNNASSWRTTPIKDCKITVQTKWLGGLDNMGAGLVFRFQNDRQFYIFWIAAKGFYIIGKIDGNNITRFANWTQSSSINKKGTNTLTVELMGDSISCYVNDTKLLTTNDASYPSGGFGFYCQKGVLAGFDNLKVWEYTDNADNNVSAKIMKSYDVPVQGPYGIAYVNNNISIVDWFNGQIVTLESGSGKTKSLFKLSGLFRYQGMEFVNNQVWIADYNKKINAYNMEGEIIKTINYDGRKPSGITFGNGFFWISDPDEMKIRQYQDWKLVKTIAIPGHIVNPRGLEYENNSLWLASPTNEAVYRIDPASGRELAKYSLKGINVHGLEWINNFLWITDHSNKKVIQLNIDKK